MKFGSWFEAVQDEPFPRPFPTQSNVGTTSTAEENSTPNFNLQLQVSHEIPQNWGADKSQITTFKATYMWY
jgi:hypothetical protein